MDMSNREYEKFVEARAKKSPTAKNCLFAFFIGGGICTLGQGLTDLYTGLGLDQREAGTAVSVTLIALSVVLTGLNLYGRLARYGGAGTLVPITGFANAVSAPAIDFRAEGLITGTAVKMFTIAGPVIAYGTAASVVYGIALMLLGKGG